MAVIKPLTTPTSNPTALQDTYNPMNGGNFNPMGAGTFNPMGQTADPTKLNPTAPIINKASSIPNPSNPNNNPNPANPINTVNKTPFQPVDVNSAFQKYGYTPNAQDVSYWSDPNKKNGTGNLEANLAARYLKQYGKPWAPTTPVLPNADNNMNKNDVAPFAGEKSAINAPTGDNGKPTDVNGALIKDGTQNTDLNNTDTTKTNGTGDPYLDMLNKIFAESQKANLPTQDEINAQSELDALGSSKKMGDTAINGKPIAMDYITGQKQALQENYNAQAEPLTTKLGRLQAARMATSANAEKAYGNAKDIMTLQQNKDLKQTDLQNSLITAGYSALTPDQAKNVDASQIVKDAKGNSYLRPPLKKEFNQVVSPDGSIYVLNSTTGDISLAKAGSGVNPSDIQLQSDGNGNIISYNKRTGETTYVIGGAGQNNKPATDTEKITKLYADRMSNSEGIINGIDTSKLGAGDWALLGSNIPGSNILKKPEIQQLEQAERDFVNAILRKESGSAINPSEFESARKQYFPSFGDDKTTLAQKAKNRQIAIDGMKNAAGNAYKGGSGNGADTIGDQSDSAFQ